MQAKLTIDFLAAAGLIASLAIAGRAANAQSISSQMDEINAGIRARAEAQKGKAPQEIRIQATPSSADTAKALNRLDRETHKYGVPLTADTREQIETSQKAERAERLAKMSPEERADLRARNAAIRAMTNKPYQWQPLAPSTPFKLSDPSGTTYSGIGDSIYGSNGVSCNANGSFINCNK